MLKGRIKANRASLSGSFLSKFTTITAKINLYLPPLSSCMKSMKVNCAFTQMVYIISLYFTDKNYDNQCTVGMHVYHLPNYFEFHSNNANLITRYSSLKSLFRVTETWMCLPKCGEKKIKEYPKNTCYM